MEVAIAPDYGALPTEILVLVVGHVFRSQNATLGWPLKDLVRQWYDLCLVCKHWAEAVRQAAVAVELYAAPPPVLAWLASRARVLRVASSGKSGQAETIESLVLHKLLTLEQAGAIVRPDQPEEEGQGLYAAWAVPTVDFRSQRSIGWSDDVEELYPWQAAAAGHTLTFDNMVQELEGVKDHSTMQAARPKSWSLSSWHKLEVLHLEGPVNWHGDYCTFSTVPLASLINLRELRLSCFYDYDLSGLPPSMRSLRLHYEPFMFPDLAHLGMGCSFSLLRLPPSTRLNELVVVKQQGLVAFSWAAVSRCCCRLAVFGSMGPNQNCIDQNLQPVPLIAVELRGEQQQGELLVALYDKHTISLQEQQQANEVLRRAWLADFAQGGHALHALFLGSRMIATTPVATAAEVQLLPLASGGDAEAQLRQYHARAVEAALEENFLAPRAAPVCLPEAAAGHEALRCGEVIPPTHWDMPGLVALQLTEGDAPAAQHNTALQLNGLKL